MKLNQIECEKNKWDAYFKQSLDGKGQEHDHSLWWQISDDDSILIIKKYLRNRHNTHILEPGCGSGGSSFYLANFYEDLQITLCDVSEYALAFARSVEPPFLKESVSYVKAEASTMPFRNGTFDLTWNVGVIEHYPLEQIGEMAEEMARVTKPGGYVMLAIPNRNSIATLKAWLLGSWFGRKVLFWVPGYRFDSEILYRNNQLEKFLAYKLGRQVFVEFAGNMLWVGAPHYLVNKTNLWFPRSPFSFLTFFIFRK